MQGNITSSTQPSSQALLAALTAEGDRESESMVDHMRMIHLGRKLDSPCSCYMTVANKRPASPNAGGQACNGL